MSNVDSNSTNQSRKANGAYVAGLSEAGQLSNKQFLQDMFGDDWVKACVANFTAPPDADSGTNWTAKPAKDAVAGIPDKSNNYFCISTFEGGKRQIALFQRQYIIPLDDVGTKISEDVARRILPPPTYRLETSKGNYQWGYRLDSGCDDPRVYDVIFHAIKNHKELNPSGADPGQSGVNRYVRLPAGWNNKTTYGEPFTCSMREYDPKRRYSVKSIAEALGADISEDSLARTDTAKARSAAFSESSEAEIAADHILKLFDSRGMILDLKPSDQGFIKVVCPWAAEHTNPADNSAGYKPGGKGFQCFHGHCESRTFSDVKAWACDEMTPDEEQEYFSSIFEKAPEAEAVEGDGPKVLRRKSEIQGPFPTESLPEILRDAVEAIAWKVQCPEAQAASSILATVSVAGQCHVDVRNPALDSTAPISLMFMTIADSGDRKSASDKIAIKPLQNREAHMRGVHEIQVEAFKIRHAAWQTKHSAIKRGGKTQSTEQIAQALQALGPEPEPPLSYELLVSTPTLEGLLSQFMHGQPGLGLFNDEGGTLTGGHAMNKDNRTATFSSWSKLWDGGSSNDPRADREKSRNIHGKRLSTHLMMTMVVARNLISDPVAREQGFLARTLVSAPQTMRGTRLARHGATPELQAEIDAQDAQCDAAIRRYHDRIAQMLDVTPPLLDGTRNVLSPRVMNVSDEALPLWRAIVNHFEKRQAKWGQYSHITGSASKAAEQITRLAALFELFNDMNAVEISRQTLDDAGRIVRFYIDAYARLCDESDDAPENILEAEKLLSWIHEKWADDIIDARSVYHQGPGSIRTSAKAKPLIEILVSHGWLVQLPGTKHVVRGKPAKVAWKVVRKETGA